MIEVYHDSILFPGESSSMSEELRNCKSLIGDLLEAGKKKFDTTEEILAFFNDKIGPGTDKLIVDPEDILSDALAYFKSKNFDPSLRLIIKYRKQAAVDTGGVLCQFYSDCWEQLLEGTDSLPALFEGTEHRKLLSFNSGIVMSGVIKFVGKMFGQALCQTGIGFNHLSPASYWFIATGDSTIANKYVSMEDVVNPQVKEYLSKVKTVLLLIKAKLFNCV